MIVRLLRQGLLAMPVLFLAACATTSQIDPTVSASLQSHGVNQGTSDKMIDGQVLDYDDIYQLVQKDVPSSTITAYLQSTRKVYNFSYGQLNSLKAAGATPQLLNYLTETQGFYGVNTPAQKRRLTGEQRRAYFDSRKYQDQQPFAYNYPAIDDWYDSGYEESLYSPFSFNN